MNIDTWSYIFGYSKIEEIINIAMTCKYFNEIILSNKYIYHMTTIDKHELLLLSCKNNKINMLSVLLNNKDVDPSFGESECIYRACYYGNTQIVKMLLDDGRSDPSYKYNRSIICACNSGYTEIVKLLLLDSRVDPGIDHNNPILRACIHNHTEVIKLLLLSDKVNPFDGCPYCCHPYDGEYSTILYLLKNNNKEMVNILINRWLLNDK